MSSSTRRDSLSTVLLTTPTSSLSLRARFGLKTKSARQSLSCDLDEVDSVAVSLPPRVTPLPREAHGIGHTQATEQQTPSLGSSRMLPPVVNSTTPHTLRTIDQRSQTGASGTTKVTSATWSSKSPNTQQRQSSSDHGLESFRPPAINAKRKRTPPQPSPSEKAGALSQAYAKRIAHPSSEPAHSGEGARQTTSALISTHHSFHSHNLDNIRHHTSVAGVEVRPSSTLSSSPLDIIRDQSLNLPSSPGMSLNGTPKSKACYICSDRGVYAMKQLMIDCAFCWRRFHRRCAPKCEPKETELRERRKLACTFGEPGWICKVCLLKDRRPRTSLLGHKNVSHADSDGRQSLVMQSTGESKACSDDHLPRDLADDRSDVVPSIEAALTHDGVSDSHPSKEVKRKCTPDDDLVTIIRSRHVNAETQEKAAVAGAALNTKLPYRNQDNVSTSNLARPDLMEPPSPNHINPRKRLSVAGLTRTIDHLAVKTPADGDVQLPYVDTANYAYFRPRTESVLREAVADTLKDTYSTEPTQAAGEDAVMLDQDELRDMLPDVDARGNNSVDDSPASSSNKFRHVVASMPSPDSLASNSELAKLLEPKSKLERMLTSTAVNHEQISAKQEHSALTEIGTSDPPFSSSPGHAATNALFSAILPAGIAVESSPINDNQVLQPTPDRDREHRPRPVSRGQFSACAKCGRKLLKTLASANTTCAECTDHAFLGSANETAESPSAAPAADEARSQRSSTKDVQTTTDATREERYHDQPLASRDPAIQVTAKPLSRAELKKEFGSTHQHTGEQLLKLIILATYGTPPRWMFFREIADWIVQNISTYCRDSSWEGLAVNCLTTHRVDGGSNSRQLWEKSLKKVGWRFAWKLSNPGAVKERWDSVLGRCVPTSDELASTPALRATTPSEPSNGMQDTQMTGAAAAKPATPRMSVRSPTSLMPEKDNDTIRVPARVLFQAPSRPTQQPQAHTDIDSRAVSETRGSAGDLMDIGSHEHSNPGSVADGVEGFAVTEPPKEALWNTKTHSILDNLLIRHCLASHKFDKDPLSSSPAVVDKPAKITEISQRKTRKELFGEPAFNSRRRRTETFPIGLPADEHGAFGSSTPKGSIYTHDPWRDVQLSSQDEQSDEQYSDCDNVLQMVEAPRDMLMMISGNELAWREAPRPGEGPRTRPKMVYRTGKTT